MTKVTFIGNEPTKESKHIELVRQYLGNDCINTANNWHNVQLIKRNAVDGLDLIYCYDSDELDRMYLGHWNYGITSNPKTICTVLGEDVALRKGKGIEFVKILYTDILGQEISKTDTRPDTFKNIEVVRIGMNDCLDIFYCYGNDRNKGAIFLGHLNDGFVE